MFIDKFIGTNLLRAITYGSNEMLKMKRKEVDNFQIKKNEFTYCQSVTRSKVPLINKMSMLNGRSQKWPYAILKGQDYRCYNNLEDSYST